ncbi:unnamed protein product [Camellia sinensis]
MDKLPIAIPSWIPPFQLDTIGLQSCQLGPRFPEWLRSQKDFLSLDISNASISDTVPHWFWTHSNKVQHLNLYSNQLRGKVPNFSSKLNLSTLDLSNNNLGGPLPQFSPNMVSLVLAGNSFSGGISSLCEMLVPNSTLSYLDLSGNLLSGEIPDCWTYGRKLVILSLANNHLSGKIPNSIGHLVHLNTLHLENNSITGELPLSFKNCTSLFVLDVGHNKLSGNIPAWIGEEMQNLMILRLCANAFEENIPSQSVQLRFKNGTIPDGFGNLESLECLDLSRNELSCTIPASLSNLLFLSVLDLSHNGLSGKIPSGSGNQLGAFDATTYMGNRHLQMD